MLCPPSFVSPKFGYAVFTVRSPEETFKATLLKKATSLSDILADGAPLAPAAAASFDLVSVCARYIAGDHDPDLLMGYYWYFLEFYAVLFSDGCDAGSHAVDFARTVTELVEVTAESLELPALEALVPQLRLAIYQAALIFMEQDEDVRPYYASELLFRFVDKLLHRRPEPADQAVRDIASELVGAIACKPEATLDLNDTAFLWLDPNAPAEETKLIEFYEVPQPRDTRWEEARLERLQLRRQALLDADGDKTEIAWVEFSIEVVKGNIAEIIRCNANLPTTPQRGTRCVPVSQLGETGSLKGIQTTENGSSISEGSSGSV